MQDRDSLDRERQRRMGGNAARAAGGRRRGVAALLGLWAGLAAVACLAQAGRLGAAPAVNRRPATRFARPQNLRLTLPSISSTHPRVWLTPGRLDRLRRYAAANTPRWQQLKADADAALALGEDALADYWSTHVIPVLGLAYQVTGDATYARQAVRAMLLHAVPSNTLTRDAYYDYRWAIPDITAGYDWCYDQMSAAERAQVASWLMDRADAVWPETNPNRVGGWAVADPANNYFYGFLTTWPAALAVYGDEPRAGFHIDLGVAKFQTLARQYTDGTGRGGLWHESTNYDSTHMLALILDAHWTATGEDLAADPSFVFLRESLLWRLHSTAPDLSHYYNWGDQSRYAEGLLYFVDRQRALFAAARVNDSTLRGYAKYWLDTIASGPFAYNQSAWEFLFYDEKITAVSYAGITPYYFAPGAGILLRRSSWQSDATYWGIWAGPLDQSHQYKDVNGFLIWKGGWLVGNANMWSSSGILNTTSNHNNYTFGGLEQTWQYPNATWPDPAGKVLKQENTAEYSYFAGWGAQAYVQEPWRGGTKIANDYVRKLVYIDPTTFLIYDRVEVVNARLTKELHLHAPRPITVTGRNYAWDNGTARLFGTTLLPRTGTTATALPVYAGEGTLPSSYRLDLEVNTGQTRDYILNVLQVAPLSTTAVGQPTAIQAATANMEGALVNNWVVLFGKSDLVATNVSYPIASSAPTHHLLVDLLPSVAYQVVALNIDTNERSSNLLVSSPQGSLRFELPAGRFRVTAIPSGLDGSAPATPRGLMATAGNTRVTLTWNPNGEPDLAGYYVYYATQATGPYTLFNSQPLTDTTATLVKLRNDTTYYFKVSAADIYGNESIPTAPVSATPTGETFVLSGRVVAEDGEGVAEVTIEAGIYSTVTGIDGDYHIPDMPPGTYTVRASKPEYTFSPPRTVILTEDRTEVDFRARRNTYTIGGRVRLEGIDWSGVEIRIGERYAWTDVEGCYIFTGLPAGTYTVVAYKPGYVFTAPQSVTVGPSQYGVDFTGVRGRFVKGINLNGEAVTVEGNAWLSYSEALADGLTVRNALTFTYPDGALTPPAERDTARMLHSGIWQYRTSASGGFSLSQTLPDGDYSICVWMIEGWRSFSRDARLEAEGQLLATGLGSLAKNAWARYGPYRVTVRDGVLDLTIRSDTKGDPLLCGLAIYATGEGESEPSYSISGTVYTNGAGLEGVTVSAAGRSAVTDASGAYTLTGLPAGTHTVRARKPGYAFGAPRTVTVGPDQTGIDFAGVPSRFVRGVNLNGGPATIEGNDWLGYDEALQNGLSVQGAGLWSAATPIPWRPTPDSETNRMLHTGLLKLTDEDGDGLHLSQQLPNGSYQVYLYLGEPEYSRARSLAVSIEGTVVAEGLGDLPWGVWKRSGPYNVTVRDGVLDIELQRAGRGNPILMGLAIFAADPAVFNDGGESFSVSGRVTAEGAGLGDVTVSAGAIETRTAADGSYTLTGLAAGTYRVTASKTGYRFGGPLSVTLGPSREGVDFTGVRVLPPPAAPSDLTARWISGTQIRLAWRDNSDNETSFRLERRSGSGPFVQIRVLPANATTALDTNLAPGRLYTYRVRARNAAGDSAYSNEASPETTAPPAAPENLIARLTRAGRVWLSWTDRSDNESGFVIERKVDNGGFVVHRTVRADARAWTDASVEPGRTYTYRVRAYNGGGSSGYSNEARVRIPGTP